MNNAEFWDSVWFTCIILCFLAKTGKTPLLMS